MSNFKYDTKKIFPFSKVVASVYITADFLRDFNIIVTRYSNCLKNLGVHMNIGGFSFKTDRKDLVLLNSLEDVLQFTLDFVTKTRANIE